MARSFSSASSQRLYYAGSPVSAFPFSFVCWFYPTNTTQNMGLVGFSSTNKAANNTCLLYGRFSLSPKVAAYCEGTPYGGAYAEATASYTANAWHHAAGVFTSASSRTVYYNGGNSATNTTTQTPDFTATLETNVGAWYSDTSNAYSLFASGRIAEAAVYNVALTASDVASLAKGYSPLHVRPNDLVAYWPLGGHHGQHDNDHWKNRYDLTAVNSPTWADHGRVIYPRRSVWNVAWSAPAAYTLTCSTATCSGTRRSASLLCGKKIAATSGTGTGARKTLTLLAGRKIVATVGSCAGARKSLVLTAQRLLSAVVAAGSGSRKTCVLLVARSLAATQGACSGARRDARMLVGRLATCVARSGSGTPQTTGLRCSRYLAVVARLGAGTANAASLEYSGAAAEFDYSVTAATEAVARRLVTEARSRSVRSEALARRLVTEAR